MVGLILGLLVALLQEPTALETESPRRMGDDDIRIVHFEPPRGVLAPGDTATVHVVLRNRSRQPRAVWIGYSVGAPNGEWHDVRSHRVALPPRSTSPVEVKSWVVPSDPAPGSYRAVVGIWSAPPEEAGDAVRLRVADAMDAFVVERAGTGFHPGVHPLGRGRLLAESVTSENGGFRLGLTPGGCDGAEIRTHERYGAGTFSARMRTPYAPGSLSAFFLYEDVLGGNDELDIEVLNDGSRKVLFTAWRDGEMTQQTAATLPFDPAAGVHEYAILRMADRVEMRIDGELYAEWRRRMPVSRMRVIANVWWPAWLECPGDSGGALEIERIDIDPVRR